MRLRQRKTLGEVGELYAITRERARQLEVRALKRVLERKEDRDGN